MKFSAWYGIVVGFLMAGQWMFSLITGAVPEIQSAPWELAFHLAAEMLTALALILGGARALKSAPGGRRLLLCALGMVIYSEIVSAGYFAQQDQWRLVGAFGVLLAGGLIAALLVWRTSKKKHTAQSH